MTKQAKEDDAPVAGDPVLLNVLATAQRFAAWYSEYTSAGSMHDSCSRADLHRDNELVGNLQRALFDLLDAVQEMNRHCTAPPSEAKRTKVPPLALRHAAVH